MNDAPDDLLRERNVQALHAKPFSHLCTILHQERNDRFKLNLHSQNRIYFAKI